MKPVQYMEYFINTVATDGMVLQHQGISSHSAEYTPICFQLFTVNRKSSFCLWQCIYSISLRHQVISCNNEDLLFFMSNIFVDATRGYPFHWIYLFICLACNGLVPRHQGLIQTRIKSTIHTNLMKDYRKISNIRCTKSPNLNVPRLVLQLYLPKLLMPSRE